MNDPKVLRLMAEVLEWKEAALKSGKTRDCFVVDPKHFTALTTALRECKVKYEAGHEIQEKVSHHGGSYHVTKRQVTIEWQKI